MNGLVFVKNNVAFTTSQSIAVGVGHSHSTVLKLIRNSMDLDQLRDLKSRSLKTKGRDAEVFDLDEEQEADTGRPCSIPEGARGTIDSPERATDETRAE